MSDAPVVKGVDGMTLTATRKRKSAANGETTEYDYEGPLAKAQAYFDDARTNTEYDDVTLEPVGGARGKVTIAIADETMAAAVTVWELRELEIMQDIGQHPYFDVSGAFASVMADIEEKIKKGERYNTADAGALETEAQRYYALRMRGVDKYISSGVEITKTLTTSGRADVGIAFTQVNQVVTLDDINPPESIVGNLSELRRLIRGVQHNLSSGSYPGSSFEAAEWEWLMRMPTVRVGAKGRREIMFRWWGLESWSKVLYPGGTWDPEAPAA
jgi:hypothetical protein